MPVLTARPNAPLCHEKQSRLATWQRRGNPAGDAENPIRLTRVSDAFSVYPRHQIRFLTMSVRQPRFAFLIGVEAQLSSCGKDNRNPRHTACAIINSRSGLKAIIGDAPTTEKKNRLTLAARAPTLSALASY